MANTIVNVGIATVDAVAMRIDQFPEPKGLVLFDELSVTTGGCPVNCAVDLAKMGISSSLMVKVGADMLGDFVLAETSKYGIDTSRCLQDSQANTAFTFVMVDETGERRFFHTLGTNAIFGADELDLDYIAEHKFCYIGGIMIMPAMEGRPLAAVLEKLRSRGVITIVDTVYADQSDRWNKVINPMLSHIDYFVPSEPEAQAITGLADPAEIAQALRDEGAMNVVVKLGEKGVYYLTEKGENGYVAAYKVDQVLDTTGAGDAWDAGLLGGLSLGLGLSDACLLGNATAAFCIQALGASTGVPSLDQIKDFQRRNG